MIQDIEVSNFFLLGHYRCDLRFFENPGLRIPGDCFAPKRTCVRCLACCVTNLKITRTSLALEAVLYPWCGRGSSVTGRRCGGVDVRDVGAH